MVARQLRVFDRQLPANGLAALENLMSELGSWWPDLLARWAPSGSEGCLRLAIRNGSINFYSNGQSIARITFGNGGRRPALGIHRKYVMGVQAPAGQKYFRLSSKEGRDPEGRRAAWGGPGMLRAWIRNSECHSGDEKRCIEAVVVSSPKVIDLEMGLPAFDRRNGALRMDMVALEQATNGIRLVFWEAKLIRDKRLRSREHNPEVFKQIDAYRLYLSDADRMQRIVEAYRNSCRIMRELHRMASAKMMIGPLDRGL